MNYLFFYFMILDIFTIKKLAFRVNYGNIRYWATWDDIWVFLVPGSNNPPFITLNGSRADSMSRLLLILFCCLPLLLVVSSGGCWQALYGHSCRVPPGLTNTSLNTSILFDSAYQADFRWTAEIMINPVRNLYFSKNPYGYKPFNIRNLSETHSLEREKLWKKYGKG